MTEPDLLCKAGASLAPTRIAEAGVEVHEVMNTAWLHAEARDAAVEEALRTGRSWFMGIELLIAPGALVPREETEILAHAAIERLSASSGGGDLLVIDMCCGAGNLACAIATQVPNAKVWASDLTDGAVAVARQNVVALGLTDRVTVVQGDLFAPLQAEELEGKIDLVVCNPPYISTARLAKDRAPLLVEPVLELV